MNMKNNPYMLFFLVFKILFFMCTCVGIKFKYKKVYNNSLLNQLN